MRTEEERKHSPKDLEKRARLRVSAALRDAKTAQSQDAVLPNDHPTVIAFHFPRDQRGRMLAKARVVLDFVGPAKAQGRARCRFLAIHGGIFEIVEADEFVENQDYRWDGQPWRWCSDQPSPGERWGIEDLELGRATTRLLEGAEWEA